MRPYNSSIIIGTLQHLDELETLYDTLNDYLTRTENYPGWIKHVYPIRETAEQAIQQNTLFVLLKDNKIAGSVILNCEPEKAYEQIKWSSPNHYAHILVMRTLVVHPDFMNMGIAQELLQFVEKHGKGQQTTSIRLDVSINNAPAIALYEKMGYIRQGTVDLGLNYAHLKWFHLYEKIL